MLQSTRRYAVLLAAVVLFVSVGCSSGSGDVTATEADFTITLDPTTATAGDVSFDIKNEAEQTHELVVFKSDLAEGDLPTNDDGDVDEEGEGVTLVDEVEDIAGGSEESLTVNLEAGKYVVICNLPGHYAQGMHASLSVA